MKKDTRYVVGVIVILLVLIFISSSSITGQVGFPFKFFRKSTDLAVVPSKDVTPVKAPTLRTPITDIDSIKRIRKAPYCKDSDGGINIYEKGFVNSNSFQAYDICDWDDPNYVWERYCYGTEAKSKKVFCGTGKICLDGKCISSNGPSNYLGITIEYDSHVDLAESGYPGVSTSEKTIKISTPRSEGFTFVESPSIKTNKVWLNRKDDKLLIFYYNPSSAPSLKYLRSIPATDGKRSHLLKLENGDLITVKPSFTSIWMRYYLNWNTNEDAIVSLFGIKNNEISSLGNTFSLVESNELTLYEAGKDIQLGTYNGDYNTLDGTIIKDPKANGASDQIILEVPI